MMQLKISLNQFILTFSLSLSSRSTSVMHDAIQSTYHLLVTSCLPYRMYTILLPPSSLTPACLAKCGENHYAIADKWYQANKKTDKAANLAELAINDMANVLKVCEKSKACIKTELGS